MVVGSMSFIVREEFNISGNQSSCSIAFEEFDSARNYILDFVKAEIVFQGDTSREIYLEYKKDYFEARVEFDGNSVEFYTEEV